MSSALAETIKLVSEKCPVPLERTHMDEVILGIFFTGVKLSTGHSGVAFTPIGEIPEAVCCPTSAARMPPAGKLEGKTVPEILSYAMDANVLKSAIGVATLNALSQSILESESGVNYRFIRDHDGYDLLEIQPHESVTLVGAFGPYIRRLKMMGNPFFVVEKNPQTLRPDDFKHFRPPSELGSALKDSDVVIITGTAIVNHTLDGILSGLGPKHRAAIVGPTASMLPDAFFARGVSVMAGIRILNPDLMVKILKQAGSAYHLLQQSSEKIAFLKDSFGPA